MSLKDKLAGKLAEKQAYTARTTSAQRRYHRQQRRAAVRQDLRDRLTGKAPDANPGDRR